MKLFIKGFLIALFFFGIYACGEKDSSSPKNVSDVKPVSVTVKDRNLSEDFKNYWYDGTAEITSYQLTQARYGELREGTAVNIFVTEDFLPEIQVKADKVSEENIPVLKFNQTKDFNTGIYPYSIMTSTFSPLRSTAHALKVSHSMQEWCGQAYVQLNNRKDFEIRSHSYFQGEADAEFNLQKTWLETELWNLIRINPEELPTGDLQVIPSFEFLRMSHQETKAYEVFASLKQGDSLTSYKLMYPELKRELILYFNSTFPFEIEKWEETNAPINSEGEGLTTTAVKMKRIKTAYWQQKSKNFESLRDSLGLK